MDQAKEKIKTLKKVFKNWGVAKKHNTKLVHLASGIAVVSMKITKNDLTPHTSETKVLFGGYHPMAANLAGAMGVYSLLEEYEEPLLARAEVEFTEPVVLEEKAVVATARVAQINYADSKNRPRKKFEALIEISNREGRLKAQVVMFYIAKPIPLRQKEISVLRTNAANFFKLPAK